MVKMLGIHLKDEFNIDITLILDINVMFKVISEGKDSCILHFRSQNMRFPLKNQFYIEMTLIIDLKVNVKDISGYNI